MLIKIIQSYWQVCRLSLSPAQTPDSRFMTGMLIFLFVVVKLGALLVIPQIKTQQYQLMIIQLLVVTVTLLGYTFFILKINQKLDRFTRTINCLFACSVIIELLTLPVLAMVPTVATASPETASAPLLAAQITAFFILFLLAIWNIVINVFIYQQSLDIAQSRAFLVWLGLIGIQMMLLYIGGLYG